MTTFKFLRFQTLICCVLIIISCSKQNDAKIISEKFQEFDSSLKVGTLDTIKYKSGYKVIVEYDTFKNIHRIEGYLLGQKFGHYLNLNIWPQLNRDIPLGKLQDYEFKTCDGSCYSYKLNYSIERKTYSEIGSQQVDYLTFASNDTGSLSKSTYVLLFTTIPRSNIKAYYSTDGRTFKELNLTKSKSIPLILDGEITLPKKSRVIVKTEAKKLMFELPHIGDSKTFFDTLNLK